MANFKDLMMAKQQQIAENSGRRAKTVKPKDGASRWRLLPSWRSIKTWERTSASQDDKQFWHDACLV